MARSNNTARRRKTTTRRTLTGTAKSYITTAIDVAASCLVLIGLVFTSAQVKIFEYGITFTARDWLVTLVKGAFS